MNALRFFAIVLFSLVFFTACGKDQQASLFNGKEVKEDGFFQKLLHNDDEKTEAQEQEKTGSHFIQIKYPKADRIETSNTRVVLVGEIADAKDAVKIEVNGYKLRKYQAGQKEFSYIASKSLKTLKRGENTYAIKAFDKDGNVLGESSYTVVSDVKYAALANSGFESWVFALTFAIFVGRVFQKRIFG